MLPIEQEINRLEAIRDDESKTHQERYRAATELFQMLERETTKAQKAALKLYYSKPGSVYT